VVGLRAPTFLLAGVHRMSIPRFLIWDGLALCISGPLFVAVGYFGSDKLDEALRDVAAAKRYALIAALLIALGFAVHWGVKRWMARNTPAPKDSAGPPPQAPPARDEVA
jgi:membrane protein DedA with SNARE-associated domain